MSVSFDPVCAQKQQHASPLADVRLVDRLTQLANELGCYKSILDAAENNVGFYEKCGYKRKEVQMAHYFEHHHQHQHATTSHHEHDKKEGEKKH